MDEVVSTILTYVKVLVVYLVVDVIYLVLPPVSAYNKSVIEGVQGSPVELRLVPALLVYVVGAAALTWILVHAPEGRRVASAAFMGFCTYGTSHPPHLLNCFNLKVVIMTYSLDTLCGHTRYLRPHQLRDADELSAADGGAGHAVGRLVVRHLCLHLHPPPRPQACRTGCGGLPHWYGSKPWQAEHAMRVITATTPDHMLLRPREVMYIAMRTGTINWRKES